MSFSLLNGLFFQKGISTNPHFLPHFFPYRNPRGGLYMIMLRSFAVPTCSVWYVILFREKGVVHRIALVLIVFYFLFYLLNLFFI